MAWDALPGPALACVLDHMLAERCSPEELAVNYGSGDRKARRTRSVIRQVRQQQRRGAVLHQGALPVSVRV